MNCAGCLKLLKEGNSIKCTGSTCGKLYCFKCINTTSITPDRKKSWRCPECLASAKKGGDNSLTPASPGVSQNVTLRKKSSEKSESQLPATAEQGPIDVRDLTLELRRLTKEFSSVSNKLDEATKSLIHCHARLDGVVDTLKATDARLKRLEQRDSEVISLKATVLELQNEINLQAQLRLINEIEIAGIPELQQEDLQRTVLVAATKLGVSLKEEDIDFVSRVGARPSPLAAGFPALATKTPRPVVVRILRRSKRDQILRASKLHRNIKTCDLELPGEPNRVFFNERLTKQNRALFWDARTRAKAQGWFCWVSQGTICVREGEGKPAQAIRSQGELDRVLPTVPRLVVLPAERTESATAAAS